jgi:hypothetical protein
MKNEGVWLTERPPGLCNDHNILVHASIVYQYKYLPLPSLFPHVQVNYASYTSSRMTSCSRPRGVLLECAPVQTPALHHVALQRKQSTASTTTRRRLHLRRQESYAA